MQTLHHNLKQLQQLYSEQHMDSTLKALLLWYSTSRNPILPCSQTPVLLDDLFSMNTDDCVDALNSLQHLSTQDVTAFSLLMEFGLPFGSKPVFFLLNNQIQKRLAQKQFLPV